jgi:hypothetical protein
LEAARAIREIEERTAQRHHAAGDPPAFAGALFGPERGVPRGEIAGVRGDVVPGDGERIDAARTKRGQVRAPGRDQFRFAFTEFGIFDDRDLRSFLGDLVRGFVDRFDFVLHRTARRRHVDGFAVLVTHQCRADR